MRTLNRPLEALERDVIRIILAAFPLGCRPLPVPELNTAPWPGLVRNAKRHGLLPLLYAAVKALGCDSVIPRDLYRELHRSHMEGYAANARLYAELDSLLTLLEAGGIPAVLLKGSALAVTLYTDIAHRFMGDIDILVPRHQAQAVISLLERRGFELTCEHGRDFSEQMMGEATMVRRGKNSLMIEPHWHIFNAPYYMRRIPEEYLWKHTRTIDLRGRAVRIFDPELQLLHLTTHMVLQHDVVYLRWSYDIALLLSRHGVDMDFAALMADARRFNLASAVQTALLHVEDVWGRVIPEASRDAVYSAQPSLAERTIMVIMAEPYARNAWYALTAGNMKEKYTYCFRLLFPDKRYMMQLYNGSTSALLFLHLHRLGTAGARFLGSAAAAAARSVGIMRR